MVGGNLLSHTLPGAVPSARAGLASGFGMGPGVSPPLSTTDTLSGRTPSMVGVVTTGVVCQIPENGRAAVFVAVFVCVTIVVFVVGVLVPVTSK